MKTLITFCLVVLSAGCYRQSVSQIGPDRFAFTTPHHGGEDRTHLLKIAYDTCRANGYKDYGVIQMASDDSGSSLMVQCGSTASPPPQNQTPLSPQAAATSGESWSDSASKLYNSFKESFK